MSEVVIKIFSGEDIRRFTASQDLSLAELSTKVTELFGTTAFSLKYKDSDGDSILLASESDLQEAISSSGGTLRLYLSYAQRAPPPSPIQASVAFSTSTGSHNTHSQGNQHQHQQQPRRCPYSRPAQPQVDAGSAPQLHADVVCDGCEGQIIGSRFNCSVCLDFDLCPTCESRGLHSQHELIRIRNPRPRFVHPSGCTRPQGFPTPGAAPVDLNSLLQGIGAISHLIPGVVEAIHPVAQQLFQQGQHGGGWGAAFAQAQSGIPTTTPQAQTSDPKQATAEHTQVHDEALRQARDQHDAARFAAQFVALQDMGLTDREELLPLLRKHNGDVGRVVSEVFAQRL